MSLNIEKNVLKNDNRLFFEEKISKATSLLTESTYSIVLTGAGISTPSGIPDFRSPESGLWSRYSPFEYASLSVFRYNPKKFYKWLRPLVRKLVNAIPNSSHYAIMELEKCGIVKSIITQNIDQLHEKAGSKTIIEVHGSLKTLSCTGCFKQIPSKDFIADYLELDSIPCCPFCQKILKPDVILFGEQLPVKPWIMAKTEVENCDLMIVAGSSLTVTPVCELPMAAKANKAKLIIINLYPTYIDNYADIVFHEDVSDILPIITDEAIGEPRPFSDLD